MDEIQPIIDVTAVRVLHDRVIELTFADGAVRVIDLDPLMAGGEIYADVLADEALFRKVRVDPEAGTIVWPNGADVSPRTLYAESESAAHGVKQ